MIRIIAVAMYLLVPLGTLAHAQDNNPFSGASSISVNMTRDRATLGKRQLINRPEPNATRPLRLHCAGEDGFTLADWKIKDGRYRVRMNGEWSNVPTGAVGPMLVMLQFTGTPCVVAPRVTRPSG